MSPKTEIRPTLNLPLLENATVDENFQNHTLRPILKLQNEIYLTIFRNYALKQNSDFTTDSFEKKLNFIQQSLQSDIVLKNTFLGITVGMFTEMELEVYMKSRKHFNRRINAMLIERLKNQVEFV